MGAFNRSTTHYCTFEKRWDADGKVFMQAQAHTTLVAKTCYQIIINEFGNITRGVADETKYCYIGVPLAAVADAAIAWFQIGGYIASMVCTSGDHVVGEGIKKYDATIVTSAADFSGAAGEFAVAAAAGSSVSVINAMLVPELILGTT